MFRSIKKRLGSRSESPSTNTGTITNYREKADDSHPSVEQAVATPFGGGARVRSTGSSSASGGDPNSGSSSSAHNRSGTSGATRGGGGGSGGSGTTGSGGAITGGSSAGRMVAAALNKAKQSANQTLGSGKLSSATSRIVVVDEPPPLTSAQNKLFKFDTCVDAADALTASSGHETGTLLPSQRVDDTTGLSDCSVLVSPEGDLLLIPGDPRQLFRKEEQGDELQNQGHGGAGPAAPSCASSALFSELMLHAKDDYASSVFLGTDLYGDRTLNRFSSKGWSITATSAAVRQTSYAMRHTADLCETVVRRRCEVAAKTAEAVDACCLHLARVHQVATPLQYGVVLDPQRPENCLDLGGGAASSASAALHHHVPTRVGPVLLESTSLHTALQGLTDYYAAIAHSESVHWQTAPARGQGHTSTSSSSSAATPDPPGVVAALRRATDVLEERAGRRQGALDEAARRVQQMEQRLRGLQQLAARHWDAVFAAEDAVTRKVELALQERSRERERLRLEHLRTADVVVGGEGGAGATSEEIWSIVSTVAESMEDGSFEPIDMPEVLLPVPRGRSIEDGNAIGAAATDPPSASSAEPNPQSPNGDDSTDGAGSNPSNPKVPPLPNLPVVSRELIELEVGLPALRAAAMAADEEVADGADALMNLLTTLDTTRRSARVAADTALVAACNAQAACVQSMLKLERKSLEARLARLEEAECLAAQIDVRADLDRFIAVDKASRGGTSHLGDDDDGGVASALAILSRHVDGSMGSDPLHRMTVEVGVTADDDRSSTTTEALAVALDRVFQNDNALLAPGADPASTPVALERTAFEEAVSFLCTSVAKVGPAARARRSTLCYLLNSKRSSQAEVPTPLQFRALCRLFSAILTGCSSEEGGVSNAKMCIMLSQTFYVLKRDSDDGLDMSESSETGDDDDDSSTRDRRVYVKNYLKSHPIWNQDDFWYVCWIVWTSSYGLFCVQHLITVAIRDRDHALSNQITESLTHSGVMANFEKGPVSNNSKERKKSEWTETRKTKWYDLNALERTEAASQVQAVVFAQLGALAHSMIELGCGLQRSCAFVRRMAVRHQLPNSQRTMLLEHLMKRDDVEKQELFQASAASI